jgi:hypothetical protein
LDRVTCSYEEKIPLDSVTCEVNQYLRVKRVKRNCKIGDIVWNE